MSQQFRHTHHDAHADADLRNRFFRGKTLGAVEFRIEQEYFLERRRLINRSLFGWGVVYGFGVHLRGQPPKGCNEPGPCVDRNRPWIESVQHGALIIAPGFALDRQGRELVTTELTKLTPLDTFVLDKSSNNCELLAPATVLREGKYLLSAHYAERSVEPVATHDPCGCDHDEHRFQREIVAYSLQPLCGACPCGEPECPDFGCLDANACCTHESPRSHAYDCHRTRLAQVLPTPLRKWQGLLIDPRAAVPLACVSVANDPDPCTQFRFACVDDACGPRRIVKNNNLLHELIRGCDLTRIESISWADFCNRGEPVTWAAFAGKFPKSAPDDCKEVATEFVVRFTRPVRRATLTPDAFTMTCLTVARNSGWREVRRVPITRIETAPSDGCQPRGCEPAADFTDQARLVVDGIWYHDEIGKPSNSELDDRHFSVEIEVFGSQILDGNGLTIDADPRGPTPDRTGNGTPGGTLRTVFHVKPRPRNSEPK